jgi:O-antigen ligase
VVLFATAVLPWGGVDPVPRAVLHGVTAMACLSLLRAPVDARGVVALGAVGVAMTLGLQTGIAPHRTWEALWTLALVMGVWTVGSAGAWSEARASAVGGVFAAVAVAHAASGTTSLFGVVDGRQPDGRFWAPLVNPNHHGTLLLLFWPVVASWGRRAAGARAALAAAFVAWVGAFPLVASSMGLLVGLGIQGAALLATRSTRTRVLGALGGVVGLAAASTAVVRGQEEWWQLSAAPRLAQWGDGWAMVRDAPWFGTGAGTYGLAYPPYRTVRQFAVFDHMHADALQWVVETGAVGLVAAAGFLWLAPRAGRSPYRLGLLGALAHAWVDFPLRVPAVLVGVTLWWAFWAAGERRARPAWMVGLALLQVGAALGWLQRQRIEDLAAAALQGDVTAAEELRSAGPWRAEPDVLALRTAEDVGVLGLAVVEAHPRDAALARVAAGRLWEDGHHAQAAVALEASLRADPQDYRSWWLRSVWKARDGDALGAATDRVEAMRRWPRERMVDPKTFEQSYALFPIGVWWLDQLSDAPAHWTVRLAWQALDEEDWELVLLATEQAARLRPAAHARMPAYAEALAGLGRADDAIRWLRAWVSEEPDAVWAWVALANVGREAGQAELVGEGVARALAVMPTHPKVRRTAERHLRDVADCQGARCLPGGPASELVWALRARDAGEPEVCRAWIGEAARWSGDWAARVAELDCR